MIPFINYALINQEKNNDISLYLGLFEKSPTVLRKAIVTTPYSECDSTSKDKKFISIVSPNCT